MAADRRLNPRIRPAQRLAFYGPCRFRDIVEALNADRQRHPLVRE